MGRLGLGLLDGLFLLALLLLPVVWILDPLRLSVGPLHLSSHWGWKPVLAPVLFLACGWGLRRALRAQDPARTRWGGSKALWCVAINLLVFYLGWAALETWLTVKGINTNVPPALLEGRNAQGDIVIQPNTEPDAELLWRLKPGSELVGRVVNHLGFRDREREVAKRPDSIRVLCMGDSTTAQGWPSYAELLDDRLQREPPTPQAWEAYNLGVYGYDSLQGLRLFQKMAAILRPDVVTIAYGRNDLMKSLNGRQPDRDFMALSMSPALAAVYDRMVARRSLALLIHALQNAREGFARHKGDLPFRVPPDEYRAVLGEFVAAVRSAGAVPILVTAPHRDLRRLGPNVLGDVNRICDQYADITRQVARAQQVDLLDLAALFADPACDHYFSFDQIHFDLYTTEIGMTGPAAPGAEPGLERIAAELHKTLRGIVGTKEWTQRRSTGPR